MVRSARSCSGAFVIMSRWPSRPTAWPWASPSASPRRGNSRTFISGRPRDCGRSRTRKAIAGSRAIATPAGWPRPLPGRKSSASPIAREMFTRVSRRPRRSRVPGLSGSCVPVKVASWNSPVLGTRKTDVSAREDHSHGTSDQRRQARSNRGSEVTLQARAVTRNPPPRPSRNTPTAQAAQRVVKNDELGAWERVKANHGSPRIPWAHPSHAEGDRPLAGPEG